MTIQWGLHTWNSTRYNNKWLEFYGLVTQSNLELVSKVAHKRLHVSFCKNRRGNTEVLTRLYSTFLSFSEAGQKVMWGAIYVHQTQ